MVEKVLNLLQDERFAKKSSFLTSNASGSAKDLFSG